jgi:hypothetical protein
VVHVLFYVVILGMIASGIGMMALSGAAVLMFGGESALLPDFWNYPPRIPHGIGARLLLVLLMLVPLFITNSFAAMVFFGACGSVGDQQSFLAKRFPDVSRWTRFFSCGSHT